MRHSSALIVFLAAATACTTILGDDFIVSDGASDGGGDGGTTTALGGQPQGPGGSGGGGDGGDGGAGAVGGAGPEDCTNGRDDDGDGLTDCADDDCGAFQCIPPIPAQWTGPLTLATLPHGDPKPPCPTPYPQERYNGVHGLSADDVSCNTCSCPASNPTCLPASIAQYGQASCGGLPFGYSNIIGGCSQVSAIPGTPSVRINAPTASVTCTPQGGGVSSTPPLRWDLTTRACQYAGALGGGCGAQATCVPRSGDASYTRTCIMKSGDEVCPAPFTDKTLYSDSELDVDDTRGCSACGCQQQSASCSLSTQFYSSSSCINGLAFTIANNGVCSNQNPNGLFARAVVTGAPSGSCSVSQSAQPQGSVAATGPLTTICCLP